VLRRPKDLAAFSGTLVVEWLNVSSGMDGCPDWTFTAEEILRRGHAWAGVSAQLAGIEGGISSVQMEGVDLPGLKGSDPQRYDAGRLRASEIQKVESTAGANWRDVKEAMRLGDVNALRTVAYVIRKRSEPALKFGDFDPFEDELRVRLDDREVRRYAEGFVEKYGDNPEDLADAFDELREAADNADVAEQAIADVTAPKDQAPAQEPEPSPASLSVA
jgi:hypothetical protein